jgi:hypothetical protein
LGQLGNDSIEDAELPVAATGAGTDIAELAASDGRTCVRRSTGEVACWGSNDQGQIGDGTRNDARAAVSASGIHDALQLAIDNSSTCVLRKGGGVACWGKSPDTEPQAGSLLPVDIAGLSDAVELRAGSVGGYCARGKPGWVKCWHSGESGWTTPSEVAALAGAHEIAMSRDLTVCGITQAENIDCRDVQDGTGFALLDSAGYRELNAGNLVLCGINAERKAHCWNVAPAESGGQFSLDLPGTAPVREVAISGFHICALYEDDSVQCAKASDLLPIPKAVPLPR